MTNFHLENSDGIAVIVADRVDTGEHGTQFYYQRGSLVAIIYAGSGLTLQKTVVIS